MLLAIETVGSQCSAAVLRGSQVLAAERCPLRHGHAEVLLPMIARVTAAAGIAPVQLEAVAAATGPGGFTGIRVGLAAAQGIALALGARLIGVSSFAAVAAAIPPGLANCRALLVALDSRRADFYVQLFAPDGTTALAGAQAVLPDRLAVYLAAFAAEGRLLVAGDAAEPAAAALAGHRLVAVVPRSAPDALGVGAAALRQLQSGAAAEPARPFYLRPPDATLPDVTLPGPRPNAPGTAR